MESACCICIATVYSEGDIYSADLLIGDLNIRTCRNFRGFNLHGPVQPKRKNSSYTVTVASTCAVSVVELTSVSSLFDFVYALSPISDKRERRD